MNEQMNLMEAMQIIANAGLSVASSDGKVKVKPKRRVKSRRPKGSGSVYKLSGKRSKPYLASVTIGYSDEDGHQIKKPIGYYSTREEALNALEVYNMQRKGLINQTNVIPTMEELQKDKIKCPTVKEIWDIVFEEEVSKKSYSTMTNYKVGFKNISEIHHIKIDEVNLHVLQPVFENVMNEGAGYSKLDMMKTVIKAIFKYAMKYDYIDKDYSQYISFEATNEPVRDRKILSWEEINKLIKDDSNEAKIVLISIFTGMRPQELVGIKRENVHLEEKYMVGGIKTDNGKERIIPIHNLIKPYVKELLKQNNKYLVFDYNGRKAYEKYRTDVFHFMMDKLNTKHDPYDTRHTFATIAKLANMNEFARKKIMGHSCKNLTDDVYTHAPVEFLVNEMSKIKIESE